MVGHLHEVNNLDESENYVHEMLENHPQTLHEEISHSLKEIEPENLEESSIPLSVTAVVISNRLRTTINSPNALITDQIAYLNAQRMCSCPACTSQASAYQVNILQQ